METPYIATQIPSSFYSTFLAISCLGFDHKFQNLIIK